MVIPYSIAIEKMSTEVQDFLFKDDLGHNHRNNDEDPEPVKEQKIQGQKEYRKSLLIRMYFL